ncbi:MAG: LacI family DNA-binding transcriptional regulator [Nakamurella sp.]
MTSEGDPAGAVRTGRRPTVVEVAARAGVSTASVSRVLNGKLARPDTMDRVRAAVIELGYRPDATGRALKLGAAQQIAFAVDDLANPVYTEMMRGVEEGLTATGARLLVTSTGQDPADTLALVRSLGRGYADGLVISPLRRTPALVRALVECAVPVVIVGDPGATDALDRVRVDSGAGIRLAYRHLLDTGRRRICFVNGPEQTSPGAARGSAHRRCAAEWGGSAGTVSVDAFTVEAGELAWLQVRLLEPDALIAANDLLALGAIRAAEAAGIRVPHDLAVVGVDDIPFARIFSPALTSVSLRARERGRLAAELLLQRLSDPARPPVTLSVEPELLIRESSWRR